MDLHALADGEHWDKILERLHSGEPVPGPDSSGNTLFHKAALSDDDAAKQVIRLMSSRGADINAKNAEGWAALHRNAVFPAPAHTAVCLLDAGADPNLGDDEQRTPFWYAVLDAGEILDELEEENEIDEEHVQLYISFLRSYLDHGADVHRADRCGVNRNMVLLSMALAWVAHLKFGAAAFAAHAGLTVTYPGCRPESTGAMEQAARLRDWEPLEVLTPLTWTKCDIVRRGVELRVPFEWTWSCYVGGEKHCGRCGTCRGRRQAFAQAGVPDPTDYARRTRRMNRRAVPKTTGHARRSEARQ